MDRTRGDMAETAIISEEISAAASELVGLMIQNRFTLTTAESCTGGLIASAITDISGASAVFNQGVVTYANEAKTALLNVPLPMLAHYGAVSKAVARAMAEGARIKAGSDLAVAVTGIAGPTGGTPEKPVGLVYIAAASRDDSLVQQHLFSGNRQEIRMQAVLAALVLCREIVKGSALPPT